MKQITTTFSGLLMLVLANGVMADELTASGETSLWEPSKRVQPDFPTDAALNRMPGCAVADVSVNSEGRVEDVVIVSSVPDQTYDRATRQALRRWRFEPSADNPERQPQVLRQTVYFCLEGQEIDGRDFCDIMRELPCEEPEQE